MKMIPENLEQYKSKGTLKHAGKVVTKFVQTSSSAYFLAADGSKLPVTPGELTDLEIVKVESKKK